MLRSRRFRWVLSLALVAGCAGLRHVTKERPGWSLARGVFETNGFFRDLGVGDIDNDGYLDIVAGNTRLGGVSIWLNRSEGTRFDLSFQVARNLLVDALDVADLNGDGWDDVVVSPSGRGVQVYLNARDGSWINGGQLTNAGSYTTLIAADLNGDSKPDVVGCTFLYREKLGGVQVWMNQGDGRFGTDTGPRSEGPCRDAVVADFDGDEKPDIVAAFWGPKSTVRIWRGDGSGGWWAYPFPWEVERGIWSLAVADVDRDGVRDLLVSLYPGGGVGFVRHHADGDWDRLRPIEKKGNFWKLWAGDLREDGRVDVIASSNTGSGLRWWRYDGGWEWMDVGLPLSGDFYNFRVADLNGDGTLELVASTYGEGVRLWSAGGTDSLFSRVRRGFVMADTGGGDAPSDEGEDEDEGDFEGEDETEGGGETAGEDQPAGDAREGADLAPLETTLVIYFDHSASTLSDEARSALEYVVSFVKNHPGAVVELIGHSEPDASPPPEIGSLEQLSRVRAEAVATHLEGKGVDKGLITVRAVGEASPISPVPEANRAVEVIIRLASVEPAPPPVVVEPAPAPSEPAPSPEPAPPPPAAPPPAPEPQPAPPLVAPPPQVSPAPLPPTLPPTGETPPTYVIGPDDMLGITLWQRGKPEVFTVTVRSDGTISFLFLRDVIVGGYTVRECIKALEEELKRYFREPLVDVRVELHQSQRVLVMGAIGTTPGTSQIVTLSKATRLAEVIALAGGPHAEADMENVSISNPKGKAQYVNLYRVLFEGDQAQNVYVQPGDVVFVPSLARSSQKVYAFGELSRVGAFPLRQGMSVLDLVSEAGGYTREAVLGNVGILRTNLERPEVLTVDLKRLIKKGDLSQNVILQNRDIVYVPRHKVFTINQWVTAYTDLVRAGLVPLQLYRQVEDLAKK